MQGELFEKNHIFFNSLYYDFIIVGVLCKHAVLYR